MQEYGMTRIGDWLMSYWWLNQRDFYFMGKGENT